MLNVFFKSAEVMKVLGITGSLESNENNNSINNIKYEQLSTTVMSMEFFDRLYDDVCPNGYIRGCFEETYDGIIVQDKLRELMLNPDSENSCLFNDKDRNQYIYNLFKLLVVGGSLCQPETKVDRYFNMTKGLYKDTLTVYKQAKNDEITTAGKVFSIKEVTGLTLFNDINSPHNALFLIVDPMKKHILTIKFDYKSFW